MRSKRQAVATGRNGFALVQAVFGPPSGRTFATGCAPSVPYLFHRNRPKTRGLEPGPTTEKDGRPLPCTEGAADRRLARDCPRKAVVPTDHRDEPLRIQRAVPSVTQRGTRPLLFMAPGSARA